MNYYEHHLGDYEGATAHLSWSEDCAYRRLICLYYRSEAPIPADIKQVCRLIRAASKPERDAVQQVLGEFFELREDGWHQARCDADIARFKNKQRKAKESADARWSHTERNANADADDMRTHTERNADGMHRAPVPSPQSPDTKPSSKAASVTAHEKSGPSEAPAADAATPRENRPDRGSRLRPDWALPKAWGEWALTEHPHWTAEVVRSIAEAFRDHWASKAGADARKVDWMATWRNWCRSDITQRQHSAARPPSAPFNETTVGSRAAEATAAYLAEQEAHRAEIVSPEARARTVAALQAVKASITRAA